MNWSPIPADLLKAAAKCKPLAVERLHGYTIAWARHQAKNPVTVAELRDLARLSHGVAHELHQRVARDFEHWSTSARTGLPDPPAKRSHHKIPSETVNPCPPTPDLVQMGEHGADAGRTATSDETPIIEPRADAGRPPGDQTTGVDLAHAPFLLARSTRATTTDLQGDQRARASTGPPPAPAGRPGRGPPPPAAPPRPPDPPPPSSLRSAGKREPPGAVPRGPAVSLGLNLGGQDQDTVGRAGAGDQAAREQLRLAWDQDTTRQLGEHPPVTVGGRVLPGNLAELLGDLMSGTVLVRAALAQRGIGHTLALLELCAKDRQFVGAPMSAPVWNELGRYLKRTYRVGLGALSPDATPTSETDAATSGGRPKQAASAGGDSFLSSTDRAVALGMRRDAERRAAGAGVAGVDFIEHDHNQGESAAWTG